MSQYELPFRDRWGFCNVFLSAIGGDGANMAAKLLFKIGVNEFGLDGGYDAKYGSEKKGTATDVSVKFCPLGIPVRESGPVTRPHFLLIFHEGLIKPLGLNKGLHPDAVVIVNSIKAPGEVRDELELHSGWIHCVDATRIAADTGSRLNMPLMSVLAHHLKFDDKVVREAIEGRWPKAVKANLKAFDMAISETTSEHFPDDGRYELIPHTVSRGQIGYLNMLDGGAISSLTHSTIGRNNQIAGYGFIPAFEPEACTSCGICLTVCSDPGGLLWRDGRMVGIDPRFCKGCMRCVEACPTTKRGKALQLP